MANSPYSGETVSDQRYSVVIGPRILCGSFASADMPSAAKTQIDLMFRAFSDPIRLRILNLVQPGELCVCDLVQALKLPQPTISRHLSYLRRAGLVNVRRQQSWNYYTLAPTRSPFHTKLLECLAACFRDVPEMASDSPRAQAIRKRGGCCST